MVLSIIIPIYNPDLEKFERCLNSVKKDLSDKIELIVVDDSSPDKSFLNYLKDIKHTLITNPENLGQGLARQAGLDAANGKYVTFVDQDDEYYATHIFNDCILQEDEIPLMLRTSQVLCFQDGSRKTVWDGNTIHGMIFNKETLTKFDIKFSNKFRTNEDLYFMSLVGATSFHEKIPIFEDQQEGYTWYLWEGSTSHKEGEGIYFIENFPEYLEVQKEVLNYCISHWGITDYIKERSSALSADMYFISCIFPNLEENAKKCVKFVIDNIYDKEAQNLKDEITPEIYAESFREVCVRYGITIPPKTLYQFIDGN